MDDDVHMLVRVSLRQPNERHEVCLDVGRSGSVATVATSYSPSPCHNLLFFLRWSFPLIFGFYVCGLHLDSYRVPRRLARGGARVMMYATATC